ncbi:hypothetical protein V1520DRAFT_11374 [Lipomyces starkeyi]|uniref:Uncharacterized protein n=1 Tax=Lipomyces starkeyi NRRL Y-11557 TaxID=675824 RepID=A0A1E3Q8F6_LIPST|nr:hypothetical protein LIPSTDRAFT_110651 [Lipomyces starkeyi NRRL Y-11557]
MRTGTRRLNLFNRARASLTRNKIISYNGSKLQENINPDPTILSDGLQSFRASCILGQSTLACDATSFAMQPILQGDFKNRSNTMTMYYSAYESMYDDAGSCPMQSIFDSGGSAYYTPATSTSISDVVGSAKVAISQPDSIELHCNDLIRHFHANYLSVSHRYQPQQEARELETLANDNVDGSSNIGFSPTHHDGAELRRVHSTTDGYRYVLFPGSTTPSVSYLSSMSSISLQAHRVFDSAFSNEDQMACLGIGRRARYYTAVVIRSIGTSVISAVNSALKGVGLVGRKLKHFLICSILCFVVYASGPPV